MPFHWEPLLAATIVQPLRALFICLKSEPVCYCAEPELEVVPPEDGRTRFLIDTMAAYVMEDGCDFEHVSSLFMHQ